MAKPKYFDTRLRPYYHDRVKEWFEEQAAKFRDGVNEKNASEAVLWDFASNLSNYTIFEDEHMIIINKPPNVAAHRGPAIRIGVEEIVRYWKGKDSILAHRLDKDTSGVMVVAKNMQMYNKLAVQFSNKEQSKMKKIYLSILEGAFTVAETVTIEAYLGRTVDGKTVVLDQEKGVIFDDVTMEGKPKFSKTLFAPVAFLEFQGKKRTFAKIQIITGVTHQIRAVSSYLGHPVIGDKLYGTEKKPAHRQMLHAFELTLVHPLHGNTMTVQAPLLQDIKEILTKGKFTFINHHYFNILEQHGFTHTSLDILSRKREVPLEPNSVRITPVEPTS